MKRALALLSLLSAASALAYAPVLSAAQVTLAAQQGSSMVRPDGGYVWGAYLIQSNSTGLRLPKNDIEVDGIALGTPFERLQYQSYFATYEQKPLTSAQASAYARTQDNKLTLLIYTHSLKSVDEEEEEYKQAYSAKAGAAATPARERSYLDEYKTATLTMNGVTLRATPQVDGPYRDEFNLANGDFDFRFLGVISYVFDVSRVAKAQHAVLRFKDSTGKAYTQTVDLSKVR